MKKITTDEVRSNEEYAKVRKEFRTRIMQIKENRRVFVGPYLNFLFENRDTMLYQVQEMMRVEGITDPNAIEHEVETYNQLVPGENELKATLLIEFADEATRRVKLNELVGLQEHVKMVIAGQYEAAAEFDDAQIDAHKLSSVQYITFPPRPEAADAARGGAEIEIVTTHSACSFRQPLTEEQTAAICEDLSS